MARELSDKAYELVKANKAQIEAAVPDETHALRKAYATYFTAVEKSIAAFKDETQVSTATASPEAVLQKGLAEAKRTLVMALYRDNAKQPEAKHAFSGQQMPGHPEVLLCKFDYDKQRITLPIFFMDTESRLLPELPETAASAPECPKYFKSILAYFNEKTKDPSAHTSLDRKVDDFTTLLVAMKTSVAIVEKHPEQREPVKAQLLDAINLTAKKHMPKRFQMSQKFYGHLNRLNAGAANVTFPDDVKTAIDALEKHLASHDASIGRKDNPENYMRMKLHQALEEAQRGTSPTQKKSPQNP